MTGFHIEIAALTALPGKFWTFWKDVSGKYLGCNQLMAEHLGLSSPDDIAGITDYDIPFTRAEANLYRKEDRLVLKNSCLQKFQDTATLAHDKLHFEVIKTPLLHGNEIIGVFGVSYIVENQLLKQTNNANQFNLALENNKLSSREKECLSYFLQGKTAKETARFMQLSPRTVEEYLNNIKRKHGCRYKRELYLLLSKQITN